MSDNSYPLSVQGIKVPQAALPLILLGGISPEIFMRKYWQKRPLLVRGAVPEFKQSCPITKEALLALADDQDVESRIVEKTRTAWKLHHGPFSDETLKTFARKTWTLLVQGVNLHHPAADALMQQFRFIPAARLDDLMISYATDQGGVGPHYDAYDVFLLQAHGQRRWRIGKNYDEALQPNVPLKILQHFEPEEEWVLEPGDMLYLPPQYAHDGIAEGECMTWSIGFRTPKYSEMCTDFLHWLADDIEEAVEAGELAPLQKHYSDPKQSASENPAEIPTLMQESLLKRLQSIQWNEQSVQRFLGVSLTEPKPHVFFTPRAKSLSAKAFAAHIQKNGISLSARSIALYSGKSFFINGEEFVCTGIERKLLQLLADQRFLTPEQSLNVIKQNILIDTLNDWFEAGWLV